MLTITRSQALSFARVQYRLLAIKALDAAAGDGEREVVERLVHNWDGRLARLAKMANRIPLDESTVAVLEHLASRVAVPPTDRTVLLDWLDAFPDAVADLFPPSRVTYRIESITAPSAEPVEAKANRRATLALAA